MKVVGDLWNTLTKAEKMAYREKAKGIRENLPTLTKKTPKPKPKMNCSLIPDLMKPKTFPVSLPSGPEPSDFLTQDDLMDSENFLDS